MHDRVMPKVPGANAQPMASTNQRSVNGCRLRSSDGNKILRMNSMAKPTGGRVWEAQEAQSLGNPSKQSRKRARRRARALGLI